MGSIRKRGDGQDLRDRAAERRGASRDVAGRHPLAPGGTIGWGLSPHRPGARRRLLQASLHRLLLAPGLPGSMR